jgi:hypothetical protein
MNTLAQRVVGRFSRTDFKVKQKVNIFVLKELSEETGKPVNEVATAIQDSPVHRAIGQLAEALTEEIDRL